MSTPLQSGGPAYLIWEVDMPLLNNRFFLYDAGKAIALSILVFGGLLLILTGRSRNLTALMELLGLCSGIVLLLLVIAVLMLRNVYRMRYLITPDGIGYEAADRRARTASALAIVAGALTGNPGVLGAGLLSASRGSGLIPWSKVRTVKAYGGLCAITVMNEWRVIVRLFCPRREYRLALEWLRKCAPEARFVVHGDVVR